jgi:hypothetical protein
MADPRFLISDRSNRLRESFAFRPLAFFPVFSFICRWISIQNASKYLTPAAEDKRLVLRRDRGMLRFRDAAGSLAGDAAMRGSQPVRLESQVTLEACSPTRRGAPCLSTGANKLVELR